MSDTVSVDLTLGKVLKALRAERGMSLDDVHLRTRISVKKLGWIEDDHFAEFEAPVFVRGYIRSYAKTVGGDADNLVALYDQSMGLAEQAQDDSVGSETSTGTSRNRVSNQLSGSSESIAKKLKLKGFFKSTSMWLVAVVLVGAWLLIVLLGGLSNETPKDLTVDEKEVETELEQTVESVGVIQDAETSVEPPSSVAVAEAIEPGTIEPEASSLASNDLITDQGEAVSIGAAKPMDTSAEPELEAGEDLSDSNTEVYQSRLDFEFSDDCWVEVSDSSGSVIFADLKNKGDNLRLFGRAPFNVMLGNARAVTLNVDGKPVDIQLSNAKKTLRLTVLSSQ